MIKIVLLLISIVISIYVEPILFFLFGFSVIQSVWLVISNRESSFFSIVWIVIVGVIMDVILKNTVGSYLIISIILYYLFNFLRKFLPEKHSLFSFFIYLFSFYISISLYKIFTMGFDASIFINTILPSIFSAFFSIIFANIMNLFFSGFDNSTLKIKK